MHLLILMKQFLPQKLLLNDNHTSWWTDEVYTFNSTSTAAGVPTILTPTSVSCKCHQTHHQCHPKWICSVLLPLKPLYFYLKWNFTSFLHFKLISQDGHPFTSCLNFQVYFIINLKSHKHILCLKFFTWWMYPLRWIMPVNLFYPLSWPSPPPTLNLIPLILHYKIRKPGDDPSDFRTCWFLQRPVNECVW